MSAAWLWAGCGAALLALLTLDLAADRGGSARSWRAAAWWSGAWVALAAAFGGALALVRGAQAAAEYATGYVVEQSLSVDNLFVFVAVFAAFRVPPALQHRLLLWGVLGAMALRGVVIAGGAALVARAAWLTYLFGAVLVVAGVRFAMAEDVDAGEPRAHPAFRALRRVFPVTETFDRDRFFSRVSRRSGPARWAATPLFAALVVLELTDLVFALDSIPAVFGVTRDPLVIYSSNVFAVLGLRSLFPLVATAASRFHLLRFGVAGVLAFVGAKMLLQRVWDVSALASLVIVVGLLGGSVAASVAFPPGARAGRTRA